MDLEKLKLRDVVGMVKLKLWDVVEMVKLKLWDVVDLEKLNLRDVVEVVKLKKALMRKWWRCLWRWLWLKMLVVEDLEKLNLFVLLSKADCCIPISVRSTYDVAAKPIFQAEIGEHLYFLLYLISNQRISTSVKCLNRF